MPEPPPRKRFQIHLSTAIVLMFVAGMLIWANIRERYSRMLEEAPYAGICKGWPCPREWKSYGDGIYVSATGGIINIAFAIGILCAVWFVCERLINALAEQEEP